MDKKVDSIRFVIGHRVFEGQINMRRSKHDRGINSKTTFYGDCRCTSERITFQSTAKDIDDVRKDLYRQAEEMFGIKGWEPWVLIKVYEDSSSQHTGDYSDRGLNHPKDEDIRFHIKIERFRRAEHDGKEIWSDYFRVIPKPITEAAKEINDREFGDTSYFKGALIPDNEEAREFIQKLKDGVSTMEQRAMLFINQESIEKTIEQFLSNPDTKLLGA